MREMHADAALARNDNVGQIRNRERAGSACENRARFGKPVENGEKFELHFQFFRNRLDDQFRVADCLFYIGGGRKPGERTAADARANHGDGPHLHSFVFSPAKRAVISAVSCTLLRQNPEPFASRALPPACESDWALWPSAELL